MNIASWLIPISIIAFLSSPIPSYGDVQLPIQLPTGETLEKVDFERHVMGLFGKTGCNNGSCHGSFQGKNGFRLSLFGYEPAKDYSALSRELFGRRLDTQNPDNSLLLQKAIGSIRHEGGVRFSRDSWQYEIIRKWIQDGAKWTKGSGDIVSISIDPQEYVYCKTGQSVQMKVSAKFSDASTEDITSFCDFRLMDDGVANITPNGLITANRPGDSGLVVLYRGQVQSARILVPHPNTENYPNLSEVNFIDKEVFAKLRKMNMIPSDLASDTEFLRRIYIDTIGSLPSPEEVRVFLKDKSEDKRAKKIDELLKHPLHSAIWATKLSDITGNNTDALENPQQLKAARSQLWYDWLRKRFHANLPYDQIVRGILTATSRDSMTPTEWFDKAKQFDQEMPKFATDSYASKESLDLFWRRQQNLPTDQWGQKVAAAFLGVRLECAECHKHPTDRWTQTDYRSFANFFAGVSFINNQFSDPSLKKLIDEENEKRRNTTEKKNNNQINLLRELFVSENPKRGLLNHPETRKQLRPKALGGPEMDFKSGHDIRQDLFQWMRSPENPFFARSFVNRVWAHYFGIGIVDPVDDFSLANPPTNARLLDALAKDFIDHQFDIRHLERQILMSRTYQTSSVPNTTNKFDKNNFSRSYIRPMMAEVVLDVLNTALETSETFSPQDAPKDKRMIEVGASRFLGNPNLSYVLKIFGRPPRTSACDCERAMDPALPQTLYRMTDPAIWDKLRNPNGRVAKLMKTNMNDDELLEELFLATLSRYPNAEEKKGFISHRKRLANRNTAFTEVMWALINTREFILNH